LAESLADAIAEAIANGAIKPGERLVEIPLSERLGVSRVPLREALKILSAQGILLGGGHRGYRVIPFDAFTLEQIDEVRMPVETVLLRDAVIRWRDGEADLDDLGEAVETMAAKARLGDRRGMALADIEIHRVIRRASSNEIAGTLWDTLARHLSIVFSLQDYSKGRLNDYAQLHAEYLDQIRRLVAGQPSADEIRTTVADHIKAVR
jgi:DNA-binding GntR family transcriptional regulator